MPAFTTAALIAGGAGLLGGALNSQRKFDGYGDINALMDEFSDPSRQLSNFRRLAADAGPSRSDLLSMAAATGGSPAAASAQAQQAAAQAGDQALQSYGSYRQGLDSLRANLASQKAQMRQADFTRRRDSMSSIFNNVASMGLGYAGNMHGYGQMMDRMGQAMPSGGSTFNPLQHATPNFNPGPPSTGMYRGWNTLNN